MEEKKKILLAVINSKFIHSSPAARYIKAASDILLPQDEFETEIYECSINDATEHIIYGILSAKPDIVGFSAYIWNISVIEKVCRTLRAVNENIKIMLGGPEVSYGIDHTALRESDYDYIISGEGEKAFPAAVLYACGRFVPTELYSKINGKTVSAELIQNLDDIPFIYNEENIGEFDNRILYYESSRGCPFSCAYCLSSVCGKVRYLSLDRVKSDIDFFVSHNVPQVKFVDRTFNCNQERAYEIWQYILSKSAESQTNFHFEIGADLITEKQLEVLRKMPAGKVQLEIGIQSTCDESLREVCRYAPNDVIFRNVRLLRDAGNINIHTDLIAGLPFEDYKRFSKSFNDVYPLRAHQLQLGFLKLLSGAPLNDMKAKHGYVFTSYPPYEIIKNNYMSYDDILRLKEIEDVLERYYNSGRFSRSLKAAEDVFDSPFEMYEKLAEFFREKKLTFMPVSSKRLYDLFNEFMKGYGADLSKILLKDFYLSENSDTLPESLRYLAELKRNPQAASVQLLRDVGLSKEKKVFAKFNGDKVLIIDYGAKNPVNGRFKLLFEWAVDVDE